MSESLFQDSLIEVSPEEFVNHVLECRRCGRQVAIDARKCLNCGFDVTDAYVDPDGEMCDHGWQGVVWSGVVDTDGLLRPGTCPECVADLLDEATELAREKGRVPCLHPDHSTHNLGGDSIRECRGTGYVPFTHEQWGDITDAYHAERVAVCPECGTGGEIDRDEEAIADNPIRGCECRDCGWIGPPAAVGRRKCRTARGGR